MDRNDAISRALSEWNIRIHGIFSGNDYPELFLEWLEQHGYTITKIENSKDQEDKEI